MADKRGNNKNNKKKRFNGKDEFTTIESEKLIRLPMYYGLTKQDQDEVIKRIKEFYQK